MRWLIYQIFAFSFRLRRWLLRRLTPTGLALFLGLIVTAILGMDTQQSLAYQIFAFLLAMMAIAWVYSWRFPKTFSASRHLPRYASVGQSLRYSITLHNPDSRPQPGLRVLETIHTAIPSWPETQQLLQDARDHGQPFTLSQYYRHIVNQFRSEAAAAIPTAAPTLSPRSRTTLTIHLLPKHRGILTLKGLTIARSDPFGLFNAFYTITLPQTLLVLPKRYDLPTITLPGSRRNQPGGVSLSFSVGDSTEFRSLRDYRQGDSPRKIHWKSWAKTGKPVVKEEQDEYFVRHALVLDTVLDTSPSIVLEEAISIAASFACTLQTNESLLDLMFVGRVTHCFTSGRGVDSTDRFLEILSSVQPSPPKSFDQLQTSVLSQVGRLSGCICIFLSWNPQRQEFIQALAQQGVNPLVLVVKGPEHDRPSWGRKTPKTQHQIDNHSTVQVHWLESGKIQAGLQQL